MSSHDLSLLKYQLILLDFFNNIPTLCAGLHKCDSEGYSPGRGPFGVTKYFGHPWQAF